MIPYVVTTTFALGPVTLQAWGTMVALGIAAGTWWAARRLEARGVSMDHAWNAMVWAMVGGIVGARLLFLAEVPAAWSLSAAWRLPDGGMSAFGGVFGGLLGVYAYLRWKHLPATRILDAFAPAVLLMDGIGRIGCFLIHDHLGTPTSMPWAMVVDGVPRHEVSLYLSLAGFVGAGLLVLLERRTRLAPGLLFASALAWYGLDRFILDFFRATDLPGSDIRYNGFTLAQWLAVVLVMVAVRQITHQRRTT